MLTAPYRAARRHILTNHPMAWLHSSRGSVCTERIPGLQTRLTARVKRELKLPDVSRQLLCGGFRSATAAQVLSPANKPSRGARVSRRVLWHPQHLFSEVGRSDKRICAVFADRVRFSISRARDGGLKGPPGVATGLQENTPRVSGSLPAEAWAQAGLLNNPLRVPRPPEQVVKKLKALLEDMKDGFKLDLRDR